MKGKPEYVMGVVKKVVVFGDVCHKVEDPFPPRQLWSNYHFLLGRMFLIKKILIWKNNQFQNLKFSKNAAKTKVEDFCGLAQTPSFGVRFFDVAHNNQKSQ